MPINPHLTLRRFQCPYTFEAARLSGLVSNPVARLLRKGVSVVFNLRNLFRRRAHVHQPAEPAVIAQANGQLMTLAERMAFRHEMVHEAVREVLVSNGVPPLSYSVTVSKQDERAHKFAVLIDLDAVKVGRLAENPAEWPDIEAQCVRMAVERYKVKITAVYWRLEDRGLAAAAVLAGGQQGVSLQSVHQGRPETPSQLGGLSASEQVGSLRAAMRAHTNGQASSRKEVTQFADTQRLNPQEAAFTLEELMAFETAVRRGEINKTKSVDLGSRTYQSEYMPLE